MSRWPHLESASIGPTLNPNNGKWLNHKAHHPMWVNDKIVLPALGDGKTGHETADHAFVVLRTRYFRGLSTTNARTLAARRFRGREWLHR